MTDPCHSMFRGALTSSPFSDNNASTVPGRGCGTPLEGRLPHPCSKLNTGEAGQEQRATGQPARLQAPRALGHGTVPTAGDS